MLASEEDSMDAGSEAEAAEAAAAAASSSKERLIQSQQQHKPALNSRTKPESQKTSAKPLKPPQPSHATSTTAERQTRTTVSSDTTAEPLRESSSSTASGTDKGGVGAGVHRRKVMQSSGSTAKTAASHGSGEAGRDQDKGAASGRQPAAGPRGDAAWAEDDLPQVMTWKVSYACTALKLSHHVVLSLAPPPLQQTSAQCVLQRLHGRTPAEVHLSCLHVASC